MKHLALDAAGARDTAALDAFLTEAFDAYAKALGHDRSGPHGWLDEAIAANRVSVWRREGAIEAVLVTTVDHARETTTVDVIAVAPARAGQGLGSEILRMVEERARARGEATVPSLLSDELATNPFLRARLPEVKAAMGMAGAEDAAVFAEIRRRKDVF